MSAREALAERAKKVSEAGRQQVHAYVGRTDYLYEQASRNRSTVQDVRKKLGQLREDGVEPLRHSLEQYAPAKLRKTIQHRVDQAKGRQTKFAQRGEKIVNDWKKSLAVKDVTSLVDSVREADGIGGAAKSVRIWFSDFPPANAPVSARKSPSKSSTKASTRPRKSKPTAAKRTATKRPTTTRTASKSTANSRAAAS